MGAVETRAVRSAALHVKWFIPEPSGARDVTRRTHGLDGTSPPRPPHEKDD